MAEIVIQAQPREEFGKGAARRLRREHLIPAVLYGHGDAPIHMSLPQHATMLALRTANALLDIELAGHPAQLALPRQIQRDPVKDTIEHVDLQAVKRGEKVRVEVPLVVVGEALGEAVVIQDQSSITLEVEATNIPAHIQIDIEGQDIGYIVLAKDVVLPEGAELVTEPEDLVLSIQAPQAKDLGETVEEETEETEEEEAQE
jgi:large subunit ribosomal protein L25